MEHISIEIVLFFSVRYNYVRSPNFNLATYLSNIEGGFVSSIIIISIISISIIIIIISIISIIPPHHFESKFVQETTRLSFRLPDLPSKVVTLLTSRT